MIRVSVVVCTYNRADSLRNTLESLHHQRYQDFEVVVVNGPSDDHTMEVISSFGDSVKTRQNPIANLSISRNIGIRASAGEVVAFIDDDALPEPSWLEQAVPPFEDPEVAGVGGIVFDHTGVALQYRYSAATRFGDTRFSDRVPFDSFCVPGSSVFPYTQGTNALFRRSALARIGLFDEVFDFYLDETDLCCRLVDAGYILRQLDDAPVHHKYLPSNRRNEARVITNWSSIIRNHVYFGYRHASVTASEFEILGSAHEFLDRILADAQHHADLGVVGADHPETVRTQCLAAIEEGIALGRERATVRPPAADLSDCKFTRYRGLDSHNALRIAIVSASYSPNVSGGIARFMSDVAPALARRGHEVRVIARAPDVQTVDLEEGVWVHRVLEGPTPGAIPEAPRAVDGFASAAAAELRRIGPWWEPDVVYGSLWDVELLAIARDEPASPVVPMLATPVAEVALHEGWTHPSHPVHATYERLLALERELLQRATRIHAISDAIVETFDDLYPEALDHQRVDVAHIGRRDDAVTPVAAPNADDRIVLFVGRLEKRKGIDVFLDAARLVLAENSGIRFVVAGAIGQGEEIRGLGVTAGGSATGLATEDVEFVGEVDDDELAGRYREASLVVMPSRYESFGLVAVEAMMHGRAPIASDVGGLKEVVGTQGAGILVPVGDAEVLASAILALIDDPDELARVGASARTRYEQDFRIDAAAARLEGVLRGAAEAVQSERGPRVLSR